MRWKELPTHKKIGVINMIAAGIVFVLLGSLYYLNIRTTDGLIWGSLVCLFNLIIGVHLIELEG